MKYTHYASNAAGKGLERVVDIYVAEDFDIRATPTPSETLLSIASSEEVPLEVRTVIREILGLEGQRT